MMEWITWLLLLMRFCPGSQPAGIGLAAAFGVLVRDSGQPLPDNKGSEHAGPGVITPGGLLAPAEKHSGFPGSISKGHGAMKHLQVIWRSTAHPVCSLSCHPYF